MLRLAWHRKNTVSEKLNIFTLLAYAGGFGAIGSFYFGSRAMTRYGERCGRVCWAWRSLFMFCVFLTILTAPLAG